MVNVTRISTQRKIYISLGNASVFVLATLLLFPKIAIGSGSGVLIGEIGLFLIAPLLLAVQSINLSHRSAVAMLLFASFLVSYIYFPYALTLFSGEDVGLKSVFYTARVVGYALVGLLLCTGALKNKSDHALYIILRNSFLLHAVMALGYFAWAFARIEPSVGEIIGSVNAGSRLSPLYGMVVTGGELPLNVVGGGSANLLASHALAVLVAAYYFEKSRKVEIILYLLAVTLLLFGQSRGGVLTLLLWGSVRAFVLRRRSPTEFSTTLFVVLCIVAFTYMIASLADTLALFRRVSDAFEIGELDGSSQSRLQNYAAVFNVWISSPFYMLFGLGLDESALQARTGWTVVESMYLSVLFCGGLLSATLFCVFVGYVFRIAQGCPWLRVLKVFLIVNSVFNWSVTGGDITSAPSLFSIFFFLGASGRRVFVGSAFVNRVR